MSSWQRSRPTSTRTTWSSRSCPLIYNRISVPFSHPSCPHASYQLRARLGHRHRRHSHTRCSPLVRPLYAPCTPRQMSRALPLQSKRRRCTPTYAPGWPPTCRLKPPLKPASYTAAASPPPTARRCQRRCFGQQRARVPKACFCDVLRRRTSTVFSWAGRR